MDGILNYDFTNSFKNFGNRSQFGIAMNF